MIRRIEKFLTAVLICLGVWLAYDLYMGEGQEQNGEEIETAYRKRGLAETAGELPVRYDLREQGKAPVVKDQGALGTCWAVAASSALESWFLPEESIVFSADHLSLQNHFAKEQNNGGAYTMVMAYLAGWQGPVREEEDPYGDGISPEGLEPVKHVQEMQLLKDKDYEAIKQAVLRYGAVQSSIYMDLQNAFSTSVYYNQLECSYYYNGTEKVNHDVLIVGWDDNYSPDRFNVNTSRSGAFICQNSWGEEFGDNGFFYVSYEDIHIGNNSIVYTGIEEADNYDHLYETDLCGWVGQLGYGDGDGWFANVYQPQGEELLEAVGFYAVGKDTRYSVYVMEKNGEITSMLLEQPVARGELENIGYYTIPLEESFDLDPGKEYVVAVNIHTPDAQYPVATEYAADKSTKTVDISDGEGYISHNGVVWTRTEEAHGCNVCLKAYTKDGNE